MRITRIAEKVGECPTSVVIPPLSSSSAQFPSSYTNAWATGSSEAKSKNLQTETAENHQYTAELQSVYFKRNVVTVAVSLMAVCDSCENIARSCRSRERSGMNGTDARQSEKMSSK